MVRRPPCATRPDTLFPDTTLFRSEGTLRVQIRLVDLVARVGVSLELNVDAELDAVVQRGRADEVDFRVRSVVETGEIATGAIVNRAVTEPLLHVTADPDRNLFGCKDGGGGNHARRDERRRAEKNLLHSHTSEIEVTFRARDADFYGHRQVQVGRRH